MKNITVGNCEKVVQGLDPNIDKTDDAYKAAVILLYGSLSGKHHSKTLYARTLYPMDFIKKVVCNLKKNQIWVKGKTNANYYDEKQGGMEFWLHVTVALGFIERAV